ncbi:MAG: transposase [Ellagibacter isourolithinifaciens]|nr:transposase [Ellagibacter isourolithinifaciens]
MHSIFILTRGCLRAGSAIWRAASQRRAEENVTARLHFGRTLRETFSHIRLRKSRLKNDYLIRYHTFRGEEFPKHTRAKAAPTPIAETPLEASAGPIIWRPLSFWSRCAQARRIAIKLEQGRCPHNHWARTRITDRSASRCGLAPRNRRSGTSIPSVSASRQGNRRLKNLLVFSCNCLARSRNRWGEHYARCRGRGMPHGKALKAVARKRLEVIYAIMGDKVPYAA